MNTARRAYLTFSIHLDGNRERHDESVCQKGVYDKAIAAIRLARSRGFRVTANCTLFSGENPAEVADFFDEAMSLGIEGITVSPGYSYQHAPRQDVFLGRTASKTLFREIFKRRSLPETSTGRKRRWSFNHSSLFLDFLTGNQSYQCTPWSTPTYNIFGWQRPCYLLTDEGHTDSFQHADERYQLGSVRRGAQSGVRQLHGSLRLRGNGCQRCLQSSAEGARDRAARTAHCRPHGAGPAAALHRSAHRDDHRGLRGDDASQADG